MRALALNGPMFDRPTLGLGAVPSLRLLQWPAAPILLPFLLGGIRLAMGGALGLVVGAMTPMPLFWLLVGLAAGALLQVWVRPVAEPAAPPSGAVRLDR